MEPFELFAGTLFHHKYLRPHTNRKVSCQSEAIDIIIIRNNKRFRALFAFHEQKFNSQNTTIEKATIIGTTE